MNIYTIEWDQQAYVTYQTNILAENEKDAWDKFDKGQCGPIVMVEFEDDTEPEDPRVIGVEENPPF